MKQQLGRYRLFQTLGRGGMGTIHLALASGLGGFRKLVVLKVLRDELTLDEKFVELFMREASLAACLNHPNVIHTVEASHEDDHYFLVMEFLDGQPFSELLHRAQREPSVPLRLRLQVVCQALAGLHYAHELCDYDGRAMHLVHRDVSPSNVFVTYDGQVKLLDFGIAKVRDGEGTRPGEFKGKIGYAAPEQLRQQPADRRVDVFGAGVMLWEAIALRQLARGRSTRQTLEARLAGTEPRIAQVVEDLDPALAAICDRAMEHDPALRYPTAEAFRQALQGYLDERREALDANAIGQFMSSKFAPARASMHRLIDAQLREAQQRDGERTSITTVGPTRLRLPPDIHRDSLAPSAISVRPPRARFARWLVPTAVATLALGALWLRMRTGEPTSEPIPTSSTSTSPVAPTTSAVPAPPVRRDDAPPPSSLPTAFSPSPAVVEDAGAPLSPRRKRDRARSAPALTEPSSTAKRTGAEPERPKLRPAEPAAATPAPPTKLGGELDLRGVPKHERRRLDVDSPFR